MESSESVSGQEWRGYEEDIEMNPEDVTPLELQRDLIAGQPLLVLRQSDSKGARYLVGVEIAKLLKQQTYNMYRSMKSKGIQLNRANQHCLSFLRHKKAVPRNTHSVTLVPYMDGVRFIYEKIRERQKIEKQNQVAMELLSKKPIVPPTFEHPPVAPITASAFHPQQVPLLSQYSSPTTDHWRSQRNSIAPVASHFAPRMSFTPSAMSSHFASPARQFPTHVTHSVPEIPLPSTAQHVQRPEPSYQNSFASLLSLANLSELESQKLDEERKQSPKTKESKIGGPSFDKGLSQNPGWLDLFLNAVPPSINSSASSHA